MLLPITRPSGWKPTSRTSKNSLTDRSLVKKWCCRIAVRRSRACCGRSAGPRPCGGTLGGWAIVLSTLRGAPSNKQGCLAVHRLTGPTPHLKMGGREVIGAPLAGRDAARGRRLREHRRFSRRAGYLRRRQRLRLDDGGQLRLEQRERFGLEQRVELRLEQWVELRLEQRKQLGL